MVRVVVTAVVTAIGIGIGSLGFAQTLLTASRTVVAPGTTITLTVTGPAGHHFAIAGSTVGAGLSFGGTTLPIGPDVQVITMAVLDATGAATVNFLPPFNGSMLDRFYLVAITSPSPTFIPPSASAGVIVRNADAAGGAAGGDLAGTYPNPTIAPNAGGNILTAINASTGTISDARLSNNVATKSYVDTAVGGAVGVGATAGGDLAGTYPNPTIAPAAGGTIVSAINAGTGVIDEARLAPTLASRSYVDTAVTGTNLVAAINGSTGVINEARLAPTLATRSYVDTAVTGAVGVGATAGGSLSGTYPNPTIASSAGNAIVTAINSTGGVIDISRLPATLAQTSYVDAGIAARVAFAQPGVQSAFTSTPVINVRQLSTGDLLSLRSSNLEQFRVMADGGLVARGDATSVIPISGSGIRLSWYPGKRAMRVGEAGSSQWDDANTGQYSFAGGNSTTASGTGSFTWGAHDVASGGYSAALGYGNQAIGDGSFAGGHSNWANHFAVSLGALNKALGNNSVALGHGNAACGNYSIAMGVYATTASADPVGVNCAGTAHHGSFVFADYSASTYFRSTADNQFNVRAVGGVRMFTNPGLIAGVTLAANGSAWASVSDRNAKTAFRDLDGEAVLAKLKAMPIQEWSYKSAPDVRHVGPIAQDFWAAFSLGPDPLKITTIDPSGIALRAVQALEERTRALQIENDSLKRSLEQERTDRIHEAQEWRAELAALKVLLRRIQPEVR